MCVCVCVLYFFNGSAIKFNLIKKKKKKMLNIYAKIDTTPLMSTSVLSQWIVLKYLICFSYSKIL